MVPGKRKFPRPPAPWGDSGCATLPLLPIHGLGTSSLFRGGGPSGTTAPLAVLVFCVILMLSGQQPRFRYRLQTSYFKEEIFARRDVGILA
jgi:hypothetical protein